MAQGRIVGIDEFKGTIDRDGASNIPFQKVSFSGTEWTRESLVGKRCSFFATTNDKGKNIAKSVSLID